MPVSCEELTAPFTALRQSVGYCIRRTDAAGYMQTLVKDADAAVVNAYSILNYVARNVCRQ